MIPFLLRILHPRMTSALFAKLSKDNTFLKKVAVVCVDCYLKIVMTAPSCGKLDSKIRTDDIVGTQPLQPAKLLK